VADEVELTVTTDLDGERVDKAIAGLLGISRSDARSLFDRGVRLDGEEVSPSARVRVGQQLITPVPTKTAALRPEPVGFGVIYEDAHLVVVDKPAGLVVHPGRGIGEGTLAAGLLHRYPGVAGVGEEDRWGLVHRLDKGTSGALLVALDTNTFDSLREQMSNRRIARTYTALAHGLFDAPTGTIDAPIGPDPAHPTRRAVIQTGKPARSHYSVVTEYPAAPATLLEVELETGRTHQIRVHLAAIGHPVVGDLAYGGGRRELTASRPFLHASRIRFTHPGTGEPMEVVSPLPDELEEVLDGLG
jgi:23S rRNA pseudouridine1911/1915/1917 synthase